MYQETLSEVELNAIERQIVKAEMVKDPPKIQLDVRTARMLYTLATDGALADKERISELKDQVDELESEDDDEEEAEAA